MQKIIAQSPEKLFCNANDQNIIIIVFEICANNFQFKNNISMLNYLYLGLINICENELIKRHFLPVLATHLHGSRMVLATLFLGRDPQVGKRCK